MLIYIIHPELDENGVTDIMGRVNGWISDAEGKVIKTDLWGKRTLAYPIRKQKDGHYVFMNIEIEPNVCTQLERNLRLLEQILRFSLVAKED